MNIQIFEHIETYFLLVMRISGVFSSAPFLGSENLPAQIRIAAIMVLSMIMLPIQIAAHGTVNLPPTLALTGLVITKEVLLGVFLGFTASFTIEGIKLAGEVIGAQVGFSIVSVIDPDSQQEESVIGVFNFMIFVLTFLAVNGHHLIVDALAQSLKVVPLGMVYYTKSFVEEIFSRAPEFFIISLKIAAPIVIPILIIMVVLGIISRAVPRLEVFQLSFPVNIFVGFFVIIFFMTDLVRYIKYLIYSNIFDEMIRILHVLG